MGLSENVRATIINVGELFGDLFILDIPTV